MADVPHERIKPVDFIKASACNGSNGCIEVARTPGMTSVAIRDTKNKYYALTVTVDDFAKFLDGAKKGEFDHLVTD
jgi:hypothetical protein